MKAQEETQNVLRLISRATVDPELVDTIRGLLSRAERGDLAAFTWATLSTSNQSDCGVFADDERLLTYLIGCATRIIRKLESRLDQVQ